LSVPFCPLPFCPRTEGRGEKGESLKVDKDVDLVGQAPVAVRLADRNEGYNDMRMGRNSRYE